jgi:hypothetical protein
MAKELARRWGKFSISEEDGVGVDAIEGVTEVLGQRDSHVWCTNSSLRGLLGRSLSDQP